MELEDLRNFNKGFLKELEDLGKSFKENTEKLTFKEFIERYPDKVKPIDDLLNKDKTLTLTSFGLTLGVFTVIMHLIGIPRNELKNYRRILIILLLIVLFFIVYTTEMSFFAN